MKTLKSWFTVFISILTPFVFLTSVAQAKKVSVVSDLVVVSPLGNQRVGSTLSFVAHANGNGSTPLYQFVEESSNGRWHVVQKYSAKRNFVLSHVRAGSYVIAVYAIDSTQMHAHRWSQAQHTIRVVNVNSTVSTTVYGSPHSIGHHVLMNAGSKNLVQPEYEFRIESPSGKWSRGTYSAISTFSFIPTSVGTYHYTVYAKDHMAPAKSPFLVKTSGEVTVTPSQTYIENLPGQPYYNNIVYTTWGIDGQMSMMGTPYSHGLWDNTYSGGGPANFYLGGNYSTFSAIVGLDDSDNGNSSTVTFTDQRGQTLASETIQPGELPQPVSFSVAGVKVLIVTFSGNGSIIDVANPTVTSTSSITLPSPPKLASTQTYLTQLPSQPYYTNGVSGSLGVNPSITMVGTSYSYGIAADTFLGNSQANFLLGKKYGLFSALVGLDDSHNNSGSATVTFTDQRGQTLASETIQPGQLPQPVTFSVVGVKVLIVEFSGGGSWIDVADPVLTQ